MKVSARARRGWRETREPGIYQTHRLGCPSSLDHRAGRRCACPFQLAVPGASGGSTLVKFEGSLTAARSERRRRLAAGRPIVLCEPVATTVQTVHTVATQWLIAKSAVLAANSIADVENDLRLRILPRFGGYEIQGLRQIDLELLVAEMVRDGKSNRMIKGTISTLSRILGTATEWGLVSSNVARKIALPASQTHLATEAERVLSFNQADLMLRSATNLSQKTMLRALVEGGLRKGEMIGLEWCDVELERQTIYVRRNITQSTVMRNGQSFCEKTPGPTKGKKRRHVAISDDFVADLARWRKQSVLERGDLATALVWPGNDGSYLNCHSPNQMLDRLQRRIGLLDEDGRPLVTPHRLRHTAATLMLTAGRDLLTVSLQLGHSNLNITAQTYAHLIDEEQKHRAAAVFAGLGSAEELREELRGEA